MKEDLDNYDYTKVDLDNDIILIGFILLGTYNFDYV